MSRILWRGSLLAGLLLLGVLLVYRGRPLVTSQSVLLVAPNLNPSAGHVPTSPAALDFDPTHDSQKEDSSERDLLEAAGKDFEDRLRQLESRLPTQKDLQKKSVHEVHGPPEEIKEAAFQLGQVAENLSKNPGLWSEGLEFYKRCAQNIELAKSVRALCLNRALRLHAEHYHEVWAYDKSLVSPDVVQLAQGL